MTDTGLVFVQLSASDRGNPPRSAVATLTINITGVNDNQPYFEHQRKNVTLTEGQSATHFFHAEVIILNSQQAVHLNRWIQIIGGSCVVGCRSTFFCHQLNLHKGPIASGKGSYSQSSLQKRWAIISSPAKCHLDGFLLFSW